MEQLTVQSLWFLIYKVSRRYQNHHHHRRRRRHHHHRHPRHLCLPGRSLRARQTSGSCRNMIVYYRCYDHVLLMEKNTDKFLSLLFQPF